MLKRHDVLSRRNLGLSAAAFTLTACTGAKTHADVVKSTSPKDTKNMSDTASNTDWANFTPAEWKERLTPLEFNVLRQEGTERPGSSPFNNEKREGTYVCAGCALPLFKSETKYNSGTGWPSFFDPISPEAVGTKTDTKLFMARVEYHCSRCGGHQGHIFKDGPRPTGLRYCNNGVSLDFIPA